MVESINTRADLTVEAIAYLGFPKYGKVMIGDKAFEFFNDRNAADNMRFPWSSIKRVEGEISRKGKINRYFSIILQNESKIRFSSSDSGKLLKLLREQLGNDKVIKAPTFSGTLSNIFKHKQRIDK